MVDRRVGLALRQHLRNVQEIIAEGDYRIGYYYYVKGDKRAAVGYQRGRPQRR